MSRNRNRKKSETSTLLTGIFEATSQEAREEREAALARREEKLVAREEEQRLEEERRRQAGIKALEAEQRRLAALERRRRALEAKALQASETAGNHGRGNLTAGSAANDDAAPCDHIEKPENLDSSGAEKTEEDQQLSAFQAALDAQRKAFEAIHDANGPRSEEHGSGKRGIRLGVWLALAAALILAVSVAAVPWLGFGEADSNQSALESTAVPAASLAVTSPGSETHDVALARVSSKPGETVSGTASADERKHDSDSQDSRHHDDRNNDRDNDRDNDSNDRDNDDSDFGDLDANNPLEFRGTIIH